MSRRRIVFSDTARQQLRSMDQPTAYGILVKLDRYNLTGVGDIKRLTGVEPPE